MPSPRSRSAGPTPDSCSNCGDCSAPADNTTSRSAAAPNTLPLLIHSTPVAARPLSTTLLTCASVMTVRFGRCATGRKKADAELLRQCRPMPSWYAPTPSVVAPLKSGLRGSPNSTPASTHAGCAVAGAKVGNPEFAEAAVILALAAAITFVAAEIRQQLAITPSLGAEPFPIVEVLMLTPNEDQAVDRRRSAQYTTAGPDNRAAAGALARLSDEKAGKALIENRPVVSDREFEPKIAVGPTGLQQQHAA